MYYATCEPGDLIRGTWFSKYLIPQNELRLLLNEPDETFEYVERLKVIKVRDSDNNEIP